MIDQSPSEVVIRIMPDNSERRREPLPRSVWVLSWISFFADISSELVFPILPLFMVQVLGTTKSQIGLMEGLAVLLVALMSAYAGYRSDRKSTGGGRVKWIRIGYGMPVLGKALIACATSWSAIVGGRLLDRFGKGLRGAPRDALIVDAVPADQRGRAFGLHRAFDTTGALLGVLLAAAMLWILTGSPQMSEAEASKAIVPQTPAWVFRTILWAGSGLGLGSLFLSFLIQEPPPQQPIALPAVEADSSQKDVTSDRTGVGCIAVAEPSASPSLQSLPRSYWTVLVVLGLFSLANSSDTFLLLKASEAGYSPWAIVLVYAVYNLSYAGLSYPAGLMSDQIDRWKLIVVGWGLYSVVYAGMAVLESQWSWGVWPLMAIYGAYMALTDGIGKALVADHAPQARRGLAMGIFHATTGVCTLAASLLVGLIWDRIDSRTALLTESGLATAALILLILGRQRF